MDDRYVGLEGCEDLWELLRSVHQNQELLKGWLWYFEEATQFSSAPTVDCSKAVDLSKELFQHVVNIYSEVFSTLQ